MTATYEMTFLKANVRDAIRSQLASALTATSRVARDVWEQAVPVDTGLLESSFTARVSNTAGWLVLLLSAGEPGAGFGAAKYELGGWNWLRNEILRKRPARMVGTEPGAYYAYWVEVGTSRMAPRAPLRATADALLSVMVSFITERARSAGISVDVDFAGNFGADWLYKAALPAHTRQGALHQRLYGDANFRPPTIVRPGARRTKSGGIKFKIVPMDRDRGAS